MTVAGEFMLAYQVYPLSYMSWYCDVASWLMLVFWRCPVRTSTEVPSILAEFFVCFSAFSPGIPAGHLKFGHDRFFHPSRRYIFYQELTIWRDVARAADSILN